MNARASSCPVRTLDLHKALDDTRRAMRCLECKGPSRRALQIREFLIDAVYQLNPHYAKHLSGSLQQTGGVDDIEDTGASNAHAEARRTCDVPMVELAHGVANIRAASGLLDRSSERAGDRAAAEFLADALDRLEAPLDNHLDLPPLSLRDPASSDEGGSAVEPDQAELRRTHGQETDPLHDGPGPRPSGGQRLTLV